METISKTTQFKKRRDTKLQSIYSRCLLTRKVVLPITYIGKNLDEVIEEYIQNNFEGKCVVEGYVKPTSSKIIRYSSGIIDRGNNVIFEVVFECDICFPVEGMLISCSVKNVVKAGVRAESANDVPSPIVVFVAKDHHFNNHQFNDIQVGDIITVRVIGQRFELNDKYVSIIGELVKEKEYFPKSKQQVAKPQLAKPRLVIED
jgi:DNA-directed RNA polymerase subunit E'/Rpb7